MKEDKELPYQELRAVCFKLRSLQHLLSHQDQSMTTELDEPDIWYGLGLILGEMHAEILKHARALEEIEVSRAVKNKKKK